MKDLLQKFGLGELFGFLFPGGLLLVSLLIWGDIPKIDAESWQTFAISALLIVLAYVLGLLVATWSSQGAAWYLESQAALRTAGTRRVPFPVLRRLWVHLGSLLHWMPEFPMRTPIIQSHAAIRAELCGKSGLGGLSRLHHTPWGELALYRIVAADALGRRAKATQEEAEAIHRRLLFSQGVALVCTLLCAQVVLRLLLWGATLIVARSEILAAPNPVAAALGLPTVFPLLNFNHPLPYIHPLTLLVLAVLGYLASRSLRLIAGRWWESEFALTCMLLKEVRRVEAARAAAAPLAPAPAVALAAPAPIIAPAPAPHAPAPAVVLPAPAPAAPPPATP